MQRQGAGDGHALLLPARKLVRVVVLPVGEAHLRQQRTRLLLEFGKDLTLVLLVVGALPRQQLPGQHYVLQRRVLREQVEVLEHQTEMQPLFADGLLALGAGVGGAPQRFARDGDRAGVGRLEKVQAAQQRGLA